MVYKSLLISQCMCERSAVIKIFYEGESSGDFAIAVLRSLNVSLPESTDPMIFLLDVLTKLEENPYISGGSRYKVWVQEVRGSLIVDEAILDDLQLVQPVVIVSSSRAALTLEINASSLRA